MPIPPWTPTRKHGQLRLVVNYGVRITDDWFGFSGKAKWSNQLSLGVTSIRLASASIIRVASAELTRKPTRLVKSVMRGNLPFIKELNSRFPDIGI